MRRQVAIFLVVTNLMTLAGLVGIAFHYRVPAKLYRRIVGESRIPYITQPYRINRFYDGQRELFHIYNSDSTRTLILGDSLVSLVSWAELLGNPSVANRGIPGDTTAGLLDRIDDYSDMPINVCVLFVGTNDVLLDRPERESISCYTSLVGRCQTIWPSASILCVSVPPLAEWVESAEDRNARIQRFNVHIQELTHERESCWHIDLAALVTTKDGYLSETMTTDGVHLGAAAYVALRVRLLPHISSSSPVGTAE